MRSPIVSADRPAPPSLTPADDELLDRLERGASGYFIDHTNPANGLVADAITTEFILPT